MNAVLPQGDWPSPLSAAEAARLGGEPRRLMEQWLTAAGDEVWWTEYRADEGGRSGIVRRHPTRGARSVLAPGWNVRNRLHEYGGRPFTVHPDGERFVFTSWDDQRLWLGGDGDPRPLTPAGAHVHADPIVVGDAVWCVRETSTGPRPTDRHRALVGVPLSGAAAGNEGAVTELASSHRFLTGPRVGPGGRYAAWIGWNHPAMPWDNTEVCIAPVRDDGTLGPARVLAGGDAVCQLWWSGPEELTVLADDGGSWSPQRLSVDGTRTPYPLDRADLEIGGPLWRVGSSWGASLPGGRLALLVTGRHDDDQGRPRHGTRLAVLEPDGRLHPVDTPETTWSGLVASGETVAAMAAGPDRDPAVLHVDLSADPRTGRVTRLGRTARGTALDPAWHPQPEHRTIENADGQPVHAIVYRPRNPTAVAPPGERPPLLVSVHGGPTGHSTDALDLTTAFFTSRGFAVALVNYGGSSGHGRAYRERLRGGWGVVDVADCAAVATALAAEGLVDGERLLIRGGSAGGWTTCCALATTDADGGVFRAGTAYYPVVDLLGWATGETHDLESRYLDGLVGPLPQAADRYRERSPVNRAADLTAPLLLLQGEDDPMCPPVQAERLVSALTEAGHPPTYLTFPGEQHGFRRATSIERALEAELAFYTAVLDRSEEENR
jgi:acetyl esterase/lipase